MSLYELVCQYDEPTSMSLSIRWAYINESANKRHARLCSIASLFINIFIRCREYLFQGATPQLQFKWLMIHRDSYLYEWLGP